MHIADKNLNCIYTMRDKELNNVKEEKDLGVITNSNLKVSDQCIAANKEAYMMFGLILRNFDRKLPEVMKKTIRHL